VERTLALGAEMTALPVSEVMRIAEAMVCGVGVEVECLRGHPMPRRQL
jgi:hypothetical protein